MILQYYAYTLQAERFSFLGTKSGETPVAIYSVSRFPSDLWENLTATGVTPTLAGVARQICALRTQLRLERQDSDCLQSRRSYHCSQRQYSKLHTIGNQDSTNLEL